MRCDDGSVVRRACVERSQQRGLLVYFPDIRRPGDADDEPIEAWVSGTSRADLLVEVATMLADADGIPPERYQVVWENEDVVVAILGGLGSLGGRA